MRAAIKIHEETLDMLTENIKPAATKEFIDKSSYEFTSQYNINYKL